MTRKELADSLNVTEQTLRMWTGGIRAIPSNKLLTCKGCSIVQSITCSVLQISGK